MARPLPRPFASGHMSAAPRAGARHGQTSDEHHRGSIIAGSEPGHGDDEPNDDTDHDDDDHRDEGDGELMDMTFGLGKITRANRTTRRRSVNAAEPRFAAARRASTNRTERAIRPLHYGGRLRAITDDPLDCFSFLTGLFSALSYDQRSAWLGDPRQPSLFFRNCAMIVPVTAESPLPARFRRALPLELSTIDLWEVRRLRPGAAPAVTFVEGDVLRQCMLHSDSGQLRGDDLRAAG